MNKNEEYAYAKGLQHGLESFYTGQLIEIFAEIFEHALSLGLPLGKISISRTDMEVGVVFEYDNNELPKSYNN